MTTEVTTREGDLPAEGTSGEFDQSDYSVPYISLAQGSSELVKDGKARAGVFVASDGEQYESIDFVPLHIQFTRDFYDKEGQRAICGSTDRRVGHPRDLTFFRTHGDLDVTEGVPLACRECPFYDYAPSPKMACLKGYTVTCFDLTTLQPFMFRVRGTAVAPFKHRFVGAVAMGRTKPWARAFHMTSAKASYAGNSWLVPELEPIKAFSADEMKDWADYAAGIVAPAAVESVDHDDLPFE